MLGNSKHPDQVKVFKGIVLNGVIDANSEQIVFLDKTATDPFKYVYLAGTAYRKAVVYKLSTSGSQNP
jgi:hypothetical protein